MQEDERCCGTGTCIIDETGLCWCGQRWNGQTMCRPEALGDDAPPAIKGHNDTPDDAE
jgi:hypothetical protein